MILNIAFALFAVDELLIEERLSLTKRMCLSLSLILLRAALMAAISAWNEEVNFPASLEMLEIWSLLIITTSLLELVADPYVDGRTLEVVALVTVATFTYLLLI